MVMQPLSDGELQDSSEEDTEGSLESSTSVSISDLSAESKEDTEDPVHPKSQWTAKNGQVSSPSHAETLPYMQARGHEVYNIKNP